MDDPMSNTREEAEDRITDRNIDLQKPSKQNNDKINRDCSSRSQGSRDSINEEWVNRI